MLINNLYNLKSDNLNIAINCKFFSLVAQSCLILCDPMDCSPPSSSIHGIFHARVLEWGAKWQDIFKIQFSLVAQSCPTLCDPMDCSTPGLSVHHQLPEFTQTHAIKSMMSSNHLIFCRPLLLLPSIFPSIRVFSNESGLHIRWPKY